MSESLDNVKNQVRLLISEQVLIKPYRKDPFDESENDWIFDFRNIILQPVILDQIVTLMFEHIKDLPRIQICGLESASIPLVTALVIEAHNRGHVANGFYVRKSRKKSGLFRLIEGQVNDDPIVLVDDILNTAFSKDHVIACLQSINKKVERIVTIIRYRPLSYYERFTSQGVAIASPFELSDFNLNFPLQDVKPIPALPKKLFFSNSTPSHRYIVQKSKPVVADDGAVYLATDAGFMLAFLPSGEQSWRFRVGRHAGGKSIFSSPLIVQDKIIFGSYDGAVYCLDRFYGSLVWKSEIADFVGSSPCYASDLGVIFIGLEYALSGQRGSIVSLSLATGEVLWEYKTAALTHASPTYVSELGMVFCGGNEGVMSALSARTGELCWRFLTSGGATYKRTHGFSVGDIKSYPVFDPETKQLFFCSMDGWMYCVDAKTGVEKYKHHTDYVDTTIRAGIYGSPTVWGDRVLFAGLDKTLYCLDKKTGVLKWKRIVGGRFFGSPLVVKDRVFIGATDGSMYEFDQNGTQKSRTFLGERVTSTAAYDRTSNSLVVSLNTNDVYRLYL
jgi:outer membrane protein assembly factor BamB/orotate phosphoribosyltransferase